MDPSDYADPVVWESDDGFAAARCAFGMPHLMVWVKSGFDTEQEAAERAVGPGRGYRMVPGWSPDAEVLNAAKDTLQRRQLQEGTDLFDWQD